MRLPEGALEVEAAGERFWLLPERAAYWPRSRALLIADAHLGKAAAFRRAGLPVPRGTTEENLLRIADLAQRCSARRVIVLGDLVHDAAARRAASDAFVRWRASVAEVDIVLVRGNHDRRAGDPVAAWGVECVDDPYTIGTIALCHAPRQVPGYYGIAGHTHPAARLTGPGRDELRLPCFLFTASYAIMPAFGSFTGMADVLPGANERVYVAAGGRVIAAY